MQATSMSGGLNHAVEQKDYITAFQKKVMKSRITFHNYGP